MDKVPVDPNIPILQLKGLNERKQFAQDDLGEFDWHKGFLPINENTLTRAEGCKMYMKLGEAVYSICQTHDSRKNIIIQGQDNVWIITEDEFFQRVYVPSLIIKPSETLEFMPYARLVHKETNATDGGVIGIAWAQRPLTDIVSQINPDGSATAFVTLTANRFTLVAGVYRIYGNFTVASVDVNNATDRHARVRLFNVTTGNPAWNTTVNRESDPVVLRNFKGNASCNIGGHLNLAGNTIFEIQDIAKLSSGLTRGLNSLSLGSFEIYGSLEIWKSA